MKVHVYLFSVLCLLAMLLTLQVKADDSIGKTNSFTYDAELPVNCGITFLAVTGIAIGVFAVKKSKATAKLAAIQS